MRDKISFASWEEEEDAVGFTTCHICGHRLGIGEEFWDFPDATVCETCIDKYIEEYKDEFHNYV